MSETGQQQGHPQRVEMPLPRDLRDGKGMKRIERRGERAALAPRAEEQPDDGKIRRREEGLERQEALATAAEDAERGLSHGRVDRASVAVRDPSAQSVGDSIERRIVWRISVRGDPLSGDVAVPEVTVHVPGKVWRPQEQRRAKERSTEQEKTGARSG